MAKVSFIGLVGVMGFPVAGHLQRAGHAVTVWNRTREKAERWRERHGGALARTPREATSGAEREQDLGRPLGAERFEVRGVDRRLLRRHPATLPVSFVHGQAARRPLSGLAARDGCRHHDKLRKSPVPLPHDYPHLYTTSIVAGRASSFAAWNRTPVDEFLTITPSAPPPPLVGERDRGHRRSHRDGMPRSKGRAGWDRPAAPGRWPLATQAGRGGQERRVLEVNAARRATAAQPGVGPSASGSDDPGCAERQPERTAPGPARRAHAGLPRSSWTFALWTFLASPGFLGAFFSIGSRPGRSQSRV